MAGFSVVETLTSTRTAAAAAGSSSISTSTIRVAAAAATEDGWTAPSTTGAGGPMAPAQYSPAVAQLLQAPDLAPVKTFVATALVAKLKGNTANYRHIVDTIRTHEDVEMLPRVFLALSSCITSVTSAPDKFKELLAAIFKYDWSGGAIATETFTDLLAHLVSAKSTFLHPTLHMLARSLSAAGPPAASTSSPSTEAGNSSIGVAVTDSASEAARQRKEAIHTALRAVLALVPAGVPELYPALEEAFPHRRAVGAGSVVHYARELLRVAEYLPGLRDRLLALLVERCLEMDVEIKIDESGEARVHDNVGNEGGQGQEAALVVSEHVFVGFDDPSVRAQLDGEDGAGGQGNEEEEEEEDEEEEKKDAPEVVVDEMAEKLDSVMLLLFEFLEGQLSSSPPGPSTSNNNGSSSPLTAVRLFEGLAPTLEGPILATHHCKYVQFLLFYLALKDATGRVPTLFLDRLLGVALNDAAPAVARHAALAYAASYLVRARALGLRDVVGALVALVGAAEEHLARAAPDVGMLHRLVGDLLGEGREGGEGEGLWREEEDGDEGEEEAEAETSAWGARGRHGLFYAICQAVFYVVAFHHSTLEGEDVLGVSSSPSSTTSSSPTLAEQQQRLRAQLGRLACSPLRPLDRCLESVKREFLRLARRYALVPPGALAGLRGQEHEHQQLESFFPFDPYVLRRSSRFVATPEVYRYWQALPGLHEGSVSGEEGASDASSSCCSSEEGSSSDGSDSDSSDGEEGEGPEEEGFYEDEEEETGGAIAMSVASVASTSGFALAAAAAAARRQSSSGSKGSRRKRERADSMEFDDEDDVRAAGALSASASSSSSSSSDDDSDEEGEEDEVGSLNGLEGNGGGWAVAAACKAALAYCATGRKSPRVRKESVGSVGSW